MGAGDVTALGPQLVEALREAARVSGPGGSLGLGCGTMTSARPAGPPCARRRVPPPHRAAGRLVVLLIAAALAWSAGPPGPCSAPGCSRSAPSSSPAPAWSRSPRSSPWPRRAAGHAADPGQHRPGRGPGADHQAGRRRRRSPRPGRTGSSSPSGSGPRPWPWRCPAADSTSSTPTA